MLALLILLQTVSGPPAEEPLPAFTAKARDCRAGEDEIVVCGSAETYRLRPLPEQPVEPALPQASARIGRNKTLQATAEPATNPFASGPRAMVGIKVDF